jgi:hypothetical protein
MAHRPQLLFCESTRDACGPLRALKVVAVCFVIFATGCKEDLVIHGTAWRCDESLACAAGHECIEGVCRRLGEATDVGHDTGHDAEHDTASGVGTQTKLDVLWVVDNSSSMCQEQSSLAAGMGEFLRTLEAFDDVDIRSAVVTTNAIEHHWRGRFSNTPAETFHPFCQERRLFPARDDLFCECASCEGYDGYAGWNRAFEYQRCADADDCPPSASMAPSYAGCLFQGYCGNNPNARHWVRDASPALQRIYNLNGSVNTSCKLNCGGPGVTLDEADMFCREQLDDPEKICQSMTPGVVSGCLLPPDTEDCPADLPLVLPAYNRDGSLRYSLSDYFRCIATVGADQTYISTSLEQGMLNAWLALDPNGPAPTQVCDPHDPVLADPNLSPQEKRERCERVFLRDKAFLMIIFISDDEDCSVDEGKRVAPEDYSRCSLLGDSDTPSELVWVHPSDVNPNTSDRPLAPVYKFVNGYRSLKPDPANVFVATITGDAWHPTRDLTPEEIEQEREMFYRSITQRSNPYRLNSYICASPFGQAAYGSRYVELVERFGSNGFRANICSNAGVGQALKQIATDFANLVLDSGPEQSHGGRAAR